MAQKDLPPIPHSTPLLTNTGMLTQPWLTWFRQLFYRVGGNNALTNLELAANGTRIFSGETSPAGDLESSSIGDFYFNTSNGAYYKKTGDSHWTLQGNLTGPAGAGTNGKSAYQIWLENGHVGTETDFLNSLIGPQGDAGTGAFSPDYINSVVNVPNHRQMVAFDRVTIAASGSLQIYGRGRIL